MRDERSGLVEWVEFMSPGKTGEDTWISRVKIEHHADRELVAWVEREAVEGAREFAERVYAIAENDAEAMGDGQQLYMLRVYRPGEDDDKWQIRRPLRILQPFPEQGQAAEQPDHSLSRAIASSGVSPQVVREGMAAQRDKPCPRQGCAFQSNHPSRCLDAHGVPLPLAEPEYSLVDAILNSTGPDMRNVSPGFRCSTQGCVRPFNHSRECEASDGSPL